MSTRTILNYSLFQITTVNSSLEINKLKHDEFESNFFKNFAAVAAFSKRIISHSFSSYKL